MTGQAAPRPGLSSRRRHAFRTEFPPSRGPAAASGLPGHPAVFSVHTALGLCLSLHGKLWGKRRAQRPARGPAQASACPQSPVTHQGLCPGQWGRGCLVTVARRGPLAAALGPGLRVSCFSEPRACSAHVGSKSLRRAWRAEVHAWPLMAGAGRGLRKGTCRTRVDGAVGGGRRPGVLGRGRVQQVQGQCPVATCLRGRLHGAPRPHRASGRC